MINLDKEMASLIVGGSNLGEVISSNPNSSFPAMDTNYRELTWTFKFKREYLNFAAFLAYEINDIKSFLNDREQQVTYDGQNIDDMVILSIKRVGQPKVTNGITNLDGTPNNNTIIAEYELVATKEDA